MPLVLLSKLLKKAEAGKYAVGYFEAWDIYSFEAVLEAAEEENSPIVLGFGGTMMEQSWLARSIEPLGAYGSVMARNAKVPAAFILNEVLELDHIVEGVKSGFNVLMLDSCHLPFDKNVELTRKVVELAKPNKIEVQAEFGQLPNFGQAGGGKPTDPEKAREFVEKTDVDFLAVSIGNVHLQTEGRSPVDMERLKAIRKNVRVPIVIHGGSGFPEEVVKEVVSNGVSLFHFGTLMKKVFLEETIKKIKSLNEGKYDYQALVGSRKETDILMPAKQKIKEVVKKYIRLYGSSGKASYIKHD